MNPPITCPVCNEGKLHSDKTTNTVTANESQVIAESLFHWCDACGTEMTLAEDARLNARASRRAKQEALGKVTGSSIYKLRKSLGINQEVAGKIFGGGPVAFCKYENDDLAPSEAMDNLLWLVQKYSYLAVDLAQRAGCPLTFASPKSLDYFWHALSEMDQVRSQNIAAHISTALSISHRSWASACLANTHIEPENQVFSSVTISTAEMGIAA